MSVSDRSLNHINSPKGSKPRVLGLVPAAGIASRISPLPLSKELFPVGFYRSEDGSRLQPKPICLNLLESMHVAGAKEAYIVLRKGKWDIPAYLGSGKMLDMNLGYLVTDLHYGVPFTLDQAFPFIQEATVVFGFPDIIFQPGDAFVRLLTKKAESNADVVLGLFPAKKSQKMHLVSLDACGNVRGIQIKPNQTDSSYTWIIAAWNYLFSQFMHDYVLHHLNIVALTDGGLTDYDYQEIYMSDVIQAAIGSGLKIAQVIFNPGNYIDIGTTEDMIRAVKEQIYP